MNDETLIEALPCWTDAIDIVLLEGGITNHNFKVTDNGDGNVYVVRLGSDIPVHHISRKNEIAAGMAASAAGLSPRIRYSAEGVLVMDYIDSKALEPSDFSNREKLGAVIDLVRKCHHDLPEHLRGAPPFFWVFQVVRDYATTLTHDGSAHLEKLPGLLKAARELEKAAAPFDICFGHNDLLAANILDDGKRLWLIDWEYAGFNTPLFDLGGVASNNELVEDDERWMLETYFDGPLTGELWYRYQAMKTASLLRETMWSMISEIHSTLDFDYSAYTAENLQRFNNSYQAFQQLN